MDQSPLIRFGLYPDELLYSRVARDRHVIGVYSPKRLLRVIAGNTSMSATPDIQGQAKRLFTGAAIAGSQTVRSIVWNTTLLPYYCAYTDPGYRRQRLSDAIRPSHSHLHTRLGICATRVGKPSVLRTCGACIQSDLEDYGVTYWRRSHQLPGVLVCPVHGEPLIRTDVRYRPEGKHEYVPATTDFRHWKFEREQVDAARHEMVWEIARASADLLLTEIDAPARSTRDQVLAWLDRAGYDGRWRSLDRLSEDFMEYFSPEVIANLEPHYDTEQPLPWLLGIRRQWRKKLHPMRFVLLEIFLRGLDGNELRQPTKDAWPCLNWLAAHYLEPVVTDAERVPRKSPAHPKTVRLRCECGFVYTQQVSSQDRSKPYRIIRFGPIFEGHARAMRRAGLRTRAIAQALGVDWKTAAKLIDAAEGTGQENADALPSSDRAEWLSMLAACPDDGIKQLRASNKALYMRLYRNDHDWLRQHQPPRKGSSGRSHRVDWHKRDIELARRASNVVPQLYSAIPPRRVTRTLIAERSGFRSLVEKHGDKLPKTLKTLSDASESVAFFQVRRAKHIVTRRGGQMPTWQLLRVAGLRQSVLNERFLKAANAVGLAIDGAVASLRRQEES